MSHSSSDYSQLIDAILRDDRMTADKLASSLLKRVILFLRVRMGAPEMIAEECVYQAFSVVFEQIRNDKITDRKSVFHYLITASRNEYLRFLRREKRGDSSLLEDETSFQEPAAQLQNLIDDERQRHLDACLKKLSESNKRFILTFFSSKSVNLKEISLKFGFSYAKTRTMKTRIMQQLQKCIEKTSS